MSSSSEFTQTYNTTTDDVVIGCNKRIVSSVLNQIISTIEKNHESSIELYNSHDNTNICDESYIPDIIFSVFDSEYNIHGSRIINNPILETNPSDRKRKSYDNTIDDNEIQTSKYRRLLSMCELSHFDKESFKLSFNTIFKYYSSSFKNLRNLSDGQTILHYLCKYNLVDEVIVWIEDPNVNINIRGDFMMTPLIQASKNGNIQIVKILVDRGAKINLCDDNDLMASSYAVRSENLTLLKILLTNQLISMSMNDFQYACEHKLYDIACFLIDVNKSYNIIDSNGNTTLIIACRSGFHEIIEYIFKMSNPNVEIYNNNGMTAIHFSNDKPWYKLVARTIYQRLFFAIQNENLYDIQMLIKMGINLNISDEFGKFPLLYIIGKNKNQIFDLCFNLRFNFDFSDANGVTPLMIAAAMGKVDIVKQLINIGVNLTQRNSNKNTVLHISTINGHFEVLKVLLFHICETNILSQSYHDVNNSKDLIDFISSVNIYKQTPLICAANNKHMKCIDILIAAGSLIPISFSFGDIIECDSFVSKYIDLVYLEDSKKVSISNDINISSVEEITNIIKSSDTDRLFYACKYGMTKMVEFYLSSPSIRKNINEIANNGIISNNKGKITVTSLFVASFLNKLEIVKILLEHGANPNIPTKNKNNFPLLISSDKGNIKIIDFLIKAGADVNQINNDNISSVMAASYHGNIEIVKLLIENGANVRLVEKNLASPLHLSFGNNCNIDIIKLLLDAGADINAKNSSLNTPLFLASIKGLTKIVQLFLDYVPPERFKTELNVLDINAENIKGYTALILAASNNNLDIVNLLLEKQANLFSNNKMSALYAASKNGHIEIVKKLISIGDNINYPIENDNYAIHGAVLSGNLEIVKLLHINGALMDIENIDGVTPLLLASEKGQIDIVEYLLDNCNVDQNKVNKNNISSLFFSVQNNHYKIVEKLITRGGNINYKSQHSYTLLMLATETGSYEITKLLIESGINLDDVTKNEKKSAIYIASFFGHENIVELLINSKVKINIINKYNRTPLWCASEKGYVKIVQLLIDAGADINISDVDNITPHQIAVKMNHIEICEVLMNVKTKSSVCAICLTNPRNIVFLPCKHLYFCADCYYKMLKHRKNECPVCRSTIKESFQVYL